MTSGALHRPDAQRLLQERIGHTQKVCLLRCALSEPPAKRACVSEERYSAAVSLRLPGVQSQRSNLSCDVRALGEEMQRSSWRVRFVLREMRKYI